jgi:uncharacterized protein (UPF0262 family)
MSEDGPDLPAPRTRLYEIRLDSRSIRRTSPHVEHEREVAIFDLLDQNHFELVGHDGGPYRLLLAVAEDRLVFNVGDETAETLMAHVLSLSPFRRIVKDYFSVCESYYQAIRTAPPSRIEAIDMGRRGLHDDGSRLLAERLQGKILVDHDTARRLFTLICALHWKG